MKKFLFVAILSLIYCNLSSSQSLFASIEGKPLSKTDIEYLNGKDNMTISLNDNEKNGGTITIKTTQTYTYNAKQAYSHLRYKVLNNKKLNTSLVFIETFNDISLGCEVIQVKNGQINNIGKMFVASYTKDNGERMNYNSILPYLSIYKTSNQTFIFFETPLVVINPNESDEKIVKGKEVYYLISPEGINLKHTL